MAKVIRGKKDAYVTAVQAALNRYEQEHPGSVASLYRHNSASIRVRVIDERFARMKPPRRHDLVWDYLRHLLTDDQMAEISLVLALPQEETQTSLANHDFDHPLPSRL